MTHMSMIDLMVMDYVFIMVIMLGKELSVLQFCEYCLERCVSVDVYVCACHVCMCVDLDFPFKPFFSFSDFLPVPQASLSSFLVSFRDPAGWLLDVFLGDFLLDCIHLMGAATVDDLSILIVN